jgi:hypothetical protein
MDCGGKAEGRRRFGCTVRKAPLVTSGRTDGEGKAVSPLRSATAVQIKQDTYDYT